MTAQWIDIPSGNDTFGGYLSLPKRGKGSAVIIIQEIFGGERAVCDQYAADGYVALAPDVFWRTQPRVELTYDGADVGKGMELAQKTNIHLVVADIAATAGLLSDSPPASVGRRARGFCVQPCSILMPFRQPHILALTRERVWRHKRIWADEVSMLSRDPKGRRRANR